jgi:hypothetical protein
VTATSAPAAPAEGAARRHPVLLGVGLATGAVALGLLAGGIYYGVHGRALSDEVSTANAWSVAYDGAVAEGPSANRNMGVLLGVGCAALVTAAILVGVALRAPSHGAH